MAAPRRPHDPPRGSNYRNRKRPKGQTKSALAPIVARRATAPERANAFLFGPCTARFSFGTTKEKWGVHPPSHQHG